MLLQCPRCRAVQDDAARTCSKCGEPLTTPPARPGVRPPRRGRFGRGRPDVFQFAEPVPVAEVEQTAILPTPHPAGRAVPPAVQRGESRNSRNKTSWPAVAAAAVGLALAGGAALLLRAERTPPPYPVAAPRLMPRPVGAAPSDEITLVTDRPSGHAPAGTAVLVTAATPPASDAGARVSLCYRRASGPRVLLSAAQGSSCRASWTPPVAGRYVLTATSETSPGQLPISLDLPFTADPVKAPASRRPVALHAVVARFPRRHAALALANRLQRRGIPAMVRRVRGRNGAPAYRVETGRARR